MFTLNSKIRVGKIRKLSPIEVKIIKSLYSYVDTAIITTPYIGRIMKGNEVLFEAVNTDTLFQEGDRVKIELGYNGSYRTEFEGFVSRVDASSPIEIHCEGYSYQLRQNTYNKTFKNVDLKEVLQYLIAGTDIELDPLIPSFKLEKFVLANHSGTEALNELKKASDNNIRICFTGNLLYAGIQYLKPKYDVKYRMGWNVIKDGGLKRREARNQEVIVQYVGEKKDGTKTTAQVGNHTVKKAHVITTAASSGSSGEKKIIKSHTITDESTLQALAEAKHKSLTYDGYEGKFTTFGLPYCEPGCVAVLEDKKYPARSGRYLVDSVETTYGMQGFRRSIGIQYKL